MRYRSLPTKRQKERKNAEIQPIINTKLNTEIIKSEKNTVTTTSHQRAAYQQDSKLTQPIYFLPNLWTKVT